MAPQVAEDSTDARTCMQGPGMGADPLGKWSECLRQQRLRGGGGGVGGEGD